MGISSLQIENFKYKNTMQCNAQINVCWLMLQYCHPKFTRILQYVSGNMNLLSMKFFTDAGNFLRISK